MTLLKIVLDQHDRGMLLIIGLLLVFALITWLEGRRNK
jgi:hypothetical protein